MSPYYNLDTQYSYILTAEDSQGLTTSTTVDTVVERDGLIRVSHRFHMTIRTDFAIFLYDMDHTVWWMGNVTSYFNDSRQSIAMLSVDNGTVEMTWTNNSINNADPPYICPIAEIHEVLEEVRSDSMRAYLSQYLIGSVTVSLRGICDGFTTSTDSSPVTPATTLSTTTSSTVTPTTAVTSK